jgi:hypothetical protein
VGDVTGPDRPLAPLSGYRALDLTDRLGWLCGKVLAELGADVVKVEPPGGDPGRSDRFTWLAFNAGKRSMVLDVGAAAGREQLLRMAARSDFVIMTFTPAELARLRLRYADLTPLNPRLIVTSITPYGLDAPDAEAPASDLEIMAAGGPVSLAGDPDRDPDRAPSSKPDGQGPERGRLGAGEHEPDAGAGPDVVVDARPGPASLGGLSDRPERPRRPHPQHLALRRRLRDVCVVRRRGGQGLEPRARAMDGDQVGDS